MTDLAVAPMLVVLVTATVVLLLRGRPNLQRATSVAGTLAYAVAVGALVRHVVFSPAGGVVVSRIGGWQAPFGITLVADALAVFMLAMTAVVATYAVVFSTLFLDAETQRTYYHPLFQFVLLGATGAFLTGDLFNLFVWFEVMLLPSYVFVAFYGGATHTAAALRYVVLNLVGGMFMLVGVGGLYALTGTLNMADMARGLAVADAGAAPVVGVSAFLFVTFALKAGLVPFQFWVPAAYRSAPLPVVAMFAGVTKKVGVYVILRLYFTVFGDAAVTTSVPFVASESALAFLAPVLLVMGIASVLVGGIGAVGRDRLDELFAYSSIGQVGFVVVPIAIAAGTTSASLRHLGVLAGLLFALHHSLTKALLFLSVAAVRGGTGTTRLSELGGLGERAPLLAGVFLVGGLSLVGVPPLAGFFGKFFVFDVAARALSRTLAHGGVLDAGVLGGGVLGGAALGGGSGAATAGGLHAVGAGVVLIALLLGAVVTILYSTRAWIGCFWGAPTEAVERGAVDGRQVALLATFAGLLLLVGIGFEPVYVAADAAAEAAIDTGAYVDAVDPVESPSTEAGSAEISAPGDVGSGGESA